MADAGLPGDVSDRHRARVQEQPDNGRVARSEIQAALTIGILHRTIERIDEAAQQCAQGSLMSVHIRAYI